MSVQQLAFPFRLSSAVHKRSQQHERGRQATQENRLIYEALHFRLVQIVTGLVPAKREPPPP